MFILGLCAFLSMDEGSLNKMFKNKTKHKNLKNVLFLIKKKSLISQKSLSFRLVYHRLYCICSKNLGLVMEINRKIHINALENS